MFFEKTRFHNPLKYQRRISQYIYGKKFRNLNLQSHMENDTKSASIFLYGDYFKKFNMTYQKNKVNSLQTIHGSHLRNVKWIQWMYPQHCLELEHDWKLYNFLILKLPSAKFVRQFLKFFECRNRDNSNLASSFCDSSDLAGRVRIKL